MHFFNTEGEIFAGTNAEYYGYIDIDGKRCYYAACQADNLKLVKVCSADELYSGILENIIFICMCFIVMFCVLLVGIFRFLDRRIISSILNVNEELKKIEQGEWDKGYPFFDRSRV